MAKPHANPRHEACRLLGHDDIKIVMRTVVILERPTYQEVKAVLDSLPLDSTLAFSTLDLLVRSQMLTLAAEKKTYAVTVFGRELLELYFAQLQKVWDSLPMPTKTTA